MAVIGYNIGMIEAGPREIFPAIRVENTVLWVNREIILPFNIQEGKPSSLGVFLVNPQEGIQPKLQLGVDNVHHRNGFLGEIIIKDTSGNLYQDFDLKGVGYVSNPKGKKTLNVFFIRRRGEDDTWGTWRFDKALREKEVVETLVNQGVRTYRMAAIIQIKEIALPNGERIRVKQAKEKGLMNEAEVPVIGLRVYRTRERVRHSEQDSLTFFTKAKEFVEKELKQSLNWEEYIVWFAETLAKNLAKIHECGYWHGMPSPHNVTLACEIVDFGFGEGSKKLEDLPLSKAKQKKQLDFVQARDTLNVTFLRLVKLGLVTVSEKSVLEIFQKFEDASTLLPLS